MDGSNPVANEAVSSRTALCPFKRQHRIPELKRRIVEETLAKSSPHCMNRVREEGGIGVRDGNKRRSGFYARR